MLKREDPLAIYVESELAGDFAKMCLGILRFSPNPVVAVIDSLHAGKDVREVVASPRHVPVVADVLGAAALGAKALVLGVATPGGHIPVSWRPAIDCAVELGLCIVNGLHDRLAPRYAHLAEGQWIWDVRVEPEGLETGCGRAAALSNIRVLMIGTDMAIGKMTAGLEIHRLALERGIRSEFIATGQIGITIMGRGVALDAVRVDYASNAIEREVLSVNDAELVIVEGQGALIHPGSTANLPLLRGCCPTHLVLCHRAGQERLWRLPQFQIPPLRQYAALYEDLAHACGTFPRPRTAAIALNTKHLDESQAAEALRSTEAEYGLPCADPVRSGAGVLLDAILAPLRLDG